MTAPSFVGTNYGGGLASPGTSVTATLPSAHATSSLAVLLVTGFTTTNPNTLTPTDNLSGGLTWTLRASATDGTICAAVWTAPITVAGTLAATVSGFASGSYLRAFLYEIQGWDSGVIDGTPAGATGSGTTATVDLPSTTFADGLQMGICTVNGTPRTVAADTGYTAGPVTDNSDNSVNQIGSVIYRTLTATGNYDPQWTISISDTYAAAALTIKGTGGAPAVTTGLGQLTLTGHAPTSARSGDYNIAPDLGALSVVGHTPRISNSGHPSAITYVGAATGTTSVTLPTHQAGDMIVAFAYRDGSTTAPTVPAGQNWTTLFNSVGANTNSHAVAYKIAASGSEATGTFTSATSLVVGVYRGVSAIGGSASGSGASTTPSFSTVTMTDNATGRSFVIGFVGHRSTNVTIESPPAGMWNRTSVSDATDEAALHDTAFGVKAWSAATSSVGGTSSGWRTHTIELLSSEAFQPDGPELTLVGYAPTVSQAGGGVSITPSNAALTLTGYAPTVLSPLNVAPSVGTLTVAGYVPTVSIAGTGTSITTGVGTLVVTGYEPTQDYQTDAPITGTLTLTGYAPTVRATQSVAAGIGTLTLTGYAPSLAFSYTVTPAAGVLTATGYAPTAGISYTVAPGNAPLSLTGYAPGVQVTQPGQVTPDAGTLILTGYQPGVGISYTVAPVVGALSVTGLAPTVQVTLSAAPSVAALTLTGHAPTVQATANVWITPEAGAVVVGGYAPVLDVLLSVQPAAGAIVIVGHAPIVSRTLELVPQPGVLAVAGYAPTVLGGEFVPVVSPVRPVFRPRRR